MVYKCIKKESTTQFYFIKNKTMNLMLRWYAVLNMLNVCEMCIKQCVSKNKLYIVRLNTVWWARQITNVMFFSSFLLLKNSSILPLWICNIKCYCNALFVVKYCWIQIKNCKRLKIELISWMKSYCSENWSMFSGSQRRISIAPYKFYSCEKFMHFWFKWA